MKISGLIATAFFLASAVLAVTEINQFHNSGSVGHCSTSSGKGKCGSKSSCSGISISSRDCKKSSEKCCVEISCSASRSTGFKSKASKGTCHPTGSRCSGGSLKSSHDCPRSSKCCVKTTATGPSSSTCKSKISGKPGICSKSSRCSGSSEKSRSCTGNDVCCVPTHAIVMEKKRVGIAE